MKSNQSVVVVGGGLGGLSSAISLAQSGFNVSLYEKNSHFGGKLNRLEKEGFGFDLGPSILTMKHIFEKLFTTSGVRMEDYIPTVRVIHEWRSFFPDGTRIDLYGDLEMMETLNEHLTKQDMEEYRAFLAYAEELYALTDKGYFAEGLDTIPEIIKFHDLKDALKLTEVRKSMYSSIEEYISNPKLRDMLAYFVKYVGSSPYDAPAILNMMIYMQHAQGIWYVPGGMHGIAEGMVKLGKELGVAFHSNTEVTELLVEKDRIVAAQLADGSTIEADYFISNMEVIPAYQHLLKEEKSFVEKLEKKFEPASSGYVMHLGVKGEYPQLRHHNFFFSNDLKKNFDQLSHKKELPNDPTIYLVNVNKTDETQTVPGHENIKILPHIPYIPKEPFTEADYQAFEKRIFEKLEKMGLTDLRKRVVTKDVWVPEDIERTYYSHRGAIYGTVADRKKNKGLKHPKESEKYENLYFVGGTVNPGGGMPMVTLSGQQVHDKIVKKEEKA